MSLSSRGERAIKPPTNYFEKFFSAMGDLYSETNQGGYIPLAVAENKLTFSPSMLDKLSEVRAAGAVSASTGSYDSMLGRQGLREAFAFFMSRALLGSTACSSSSVTVRIDPNHLCISSGCGAILSHLGALLLEPGDGILLPTPTYAALYNDFGVSGGVIIDVATDATEYRITRAALEAGLAEGNSRCSPGKVRALVLLHPNNPLGTLYSTQELRLAIEFSREKSLHLIVDEIYALSVFGTEDGEEEGAFESVVSVCAKEARLGLKVKEEGEKDGGGEGQTCVEVDTNKFLGDNIHVLWGFSKDWAMSGYRVGCLYTHNELLIKAMSNVNYFSTVSNDTQDLIAAVLRDVAWCDNYLKKCRASLREAHAEIVKQLTAAKIPYLHSRAAMFVWLDLRSFLPPQADSDDPWVRERALTDSLFAEAKILFTPGEACHASEPGFYRVCFAWMNKEAVAEAFKRLISYGEKLATLDK